MDWQAVVQYGLIFIAGALCLRLVQAMLGAVALEATDPDPDPGEAVEAAKAQGRVLGLEEAQAQDTDRWQDERAEWQRDCQRLEGEVALLRDQLRRAQMLRREHSGLAARLRVAGRGGNGAA